MIKGLATKIGRDAPNMFKIVCNVYESKIPLEKKRKYFEI